MAAATMQAMVCEGPGRPLLLADTAAARSPGPGRCCCRSTPAASAAPTSTSWTASCRTRSCPLDPGPRDRRQVVAPAPASRASRSATGSACPGSACTCGALRATAARGARTCATDARFTGYTRDGGFAEYAVADERYVLRPARPATPTLHAAPLLCAGLIGYRAYRMAGEARRLGLYGFGAAAHMSPRSPLRRAAQVYAFTRPGDARRRRSRARSAPSGPAAPTSRRRNRSTPPSSSPRSARWCRRRCGAVRKGGGWSARGIHMSDIPSFPYRAAVGGARRPLGGQPHPPRRRGVSGAGRPHPVDRARRAVRTGRRQRRPRAAAQRRTFPAPRY